MPATATSPQQYIGALPEERKAPMTRLRNTILQNLPHGFAEIISYGMISYVVPHSRYPAGYHTDPKQPLLFLSLASQKNYVALYHMGLYADTELLKWFTTEYPKHTSTKLDMGKSCIRFKNPDQVPYALIGELVAKCSPEQWIALYEKNREKR